MTALGKREKEMVNMIIPVMMGSIYFRCVMIIITIIIIIIIK